MYESAAPIKKDFEVSDSDLENHDVLFVGRPDTNSALAARVRLIGLEYDGAVFHVAGKDHSSENEALVWAAMNPDEHTHMVLVAAGNSPLSTVLAARAGLGRGQYQVIESGRAVESGYSTK